MDADLYALAARQHGVFTRQQALDCGVSAGALRYRRERGQWIELARGVFRISGAPDGDRARATAAVLRVGPTSALASTSSAWLHGLPGFTVEPIHVATQREHLPRISGVRLHRLRAFERHHVTMRDGIRCTTMARTLFDVCGAVRPARAERALDTALARRLVTLAALRDVLEELAASGRPGVTRLRALLAERTAGWAPPESGLEVRFLRLVRDAGLPLPEAQVDLGGAEWIGRVDFLWRDAHLVVEIDGSAFHGGLVDQRRDAERDAALRALGFEVLRVPERDVLAGAAAVLPRLVPYVRGIRRSA